MQNEVARLRHDLDVLETATGLGLPFDRRDALRVGFAGLLGLPLALWSMLGPTGPPIAGIAIVATLIALLVLLSLDARKARDVGDAPAVRWRERKTTLGLFFASSAAALGYLFVSVWSGLTWEAATATAVFIGGVTTAVPVLLDRKRLHMLGATLPTLVYAAVLPLCDDQELMLATGLWILLAGLGSALVMRWQLAEELSDNDAD